MDRVGAEDGHAHEEKHHGNRGKQHDQNCPHPVVMGTRAGSVPDEPTHEGRRGGREGTIETRRGPDGGLTDWSIMVEIPADRLPASLLQKA